MASLSSSLAICSGCLKCGATSDFCKNKMSLGPHRLDALLKFTCREVAENVVKARQKFGLRLLASSRVSVAQTNQVFTTSTQVDQLKKVATYLFRTEIDGQIKVFVTKKNAKYAVNIEVTSLQLSNSDSRLMLVWGIYRSDSDAKETGETQFIQTLDKFALQLEFEAKQTPFYLSFLLKSLLGADSSGSEIRSHQKTNFCVPVGFSPGYPAPLGLSFSTDGSMNFAIFSRSAKSVALCLYDDSTINKPALELDLDPYFNRTGDVWHVSLESAWNFVSYGYCFTGAVNKENNVEHVLLDPYARIVGNFNTANQDPGLLMKYLGRLCKEPAFDWSGDVSPNLPVEKSVVYQMNVMRFTEHNSSELPAEVAGTFSGLSEKVHHLKDLGINAVLLEPIFLFHEQKGPYFPCHFFSPVNRYGPPGGAISTINSMKDMVKTLHAHGIEVLLEVVFTYTDVGALHGIDDSSYYHENEEEDLEKNNSLNCNYPVVQQMILDSLRYWVMEFHIDGFCFINASSMLRGFHGEYLSRPPLAEAIAFDPILSKTKIIADCWDPRNMETNETSFPHWKRWAEMNTKFCNDVRKFLRGEGLLSDLATRLCGSGDIFSDGRGPAFCFNYVTRSFGLSLVDLVSFSKSELASQLSWNCGEEGPTNKTIVLERRLKQIRNFLFILFVSLGVPILNMGDECGQSTGGSPSYDDRKPFDWNALATGFGVQTTQFISFLSSLRTRRGDLFQSRNFLKEENIDWYGSDQSLPRWKDPSCKFLAVTLRAEKEESQLSSESGDLFIAINAAGDSENVILPSPPDGMVWYRLVDTALPFPGFFLADGELVVEQIEGLFAYKMKSHSCTLFEARTNGA